MGNSIKLILMVFGVLLFITACGKSDLPLNMCEYDEDKTLTCGKSWTLVSEGVEYNVKANEPFNFPQGRDKLVGLVDPKNPGQDNTFLIRLEVGKHQLTEKKSSEAVLKTMLSDPPSKSDIGEACVEDFDCGYASAKKACINKKCVDVECRSELHCGVDELCFNYECDNSKEIYETYPQCPENLECLGTCENCVEGIRCIGFKTKNDEVVNVCAECLSDSSCKEGFKCSVPDCVPI